MEVKNSFRAATSRFSGRMNTIARHKTPREMVLLAELPRTPGGKVRRGALPDG